MAGVFGEIALPNNAAAITSSNFKFQPGFLAAQPSGIAPLTEIITGTEPEAQPQIDCETPLIRINQNDAFTNYLDVSLQVCAPQAVEMLLSNSEDFAGAVWEPYAVSRSWSLSSQGEFVAPRHVYARFRDASGAVDGLYFDDILYDPNRPAGEILASDGFALDPVAGYMQVNLDGVSTEAQTLNGSKYVQALQGGSLSRTSAGLTGAG